MLKIEAMHGLTKANLVTAIESSQQEISEKVLM